MKRLLALTLAAGFALAAASNVFAQNTQQDKMKACNTKAGEMKGDERKKFMSECLSAKPMTQQERMTACNKKAGDMKGDDRKKFMSECLKAG